jgi:uncharacterized protein YjaG (DUF416 family)
MQVKNWAKFQHFKDRRPPWVKLYRDILDDIEWHKLDGDSAKMLINIWLIASEYSGEVPDIATLAFRLRITENQVKKALSSLGHWLISERYQDDINLIQKISVADIEVPLRDREETETETKKEKEKEKKATNVACPSDVDKQTWSDWCQLRKTKKATVTQTVISGARNEAKKAGISFDEFLKVWCMRGSQGLEASWLKPAEKTQAKRTYHDISAMNYTQGVNDDGSF